VTLASLATRARPEHGPRHGGDADEPAAQYQRIVSSPEVGVEGSRAEGVAARIWDGLGSLEVVRRTARKSTLLRAHRVLR
jgi:hypothetical protein